MLVNRCKVASWRKSFVQASARLMHGSAAESVVTKTEQWHPMALGGAFALAKTGKAIGMGVVKRVKSIHPMALTMAVGLVKTGGADAAVQKFFEKKEQIDWKRSAVFGTFGCFYLGCYQFWLYNSVFRAWFPVQNAKSIAKMTVLDQCFNGATAYFITFYWVQDVIMKEKVDLESFGTAFDKWTTNIVPDNLAQWKIWIPAQIINFTFMPPQWRAMYTAGVSALWTCILSVMKSKEF